MMITWTVTLIPAIFSLLVIGLNWCGVIRWLRTGASYSPVGLIGGLLGCIACVIYPLEGAWRFFWVPLLVDYSVPGFLYALLVLGAFKK